ncbi:MAG: SDR family NAD(P)-dependent oxidoreductase [Pseudomonadota bacterium]
MTGRMAEKSVILYGAGSVGEGWGNGKAAAVLYAREGASVMCVDVHEAAAAQTAALIESEGGRAHTFAADTTDPDAVKAATEATLHRFGAVDVVHYNVGISRPGGVVEPPLSDWAKVFAVNVDGAMYAARAALPAMLAAGKGAFVFISSIASVTAGGYQYASYEASKAALNRLAQTIAVGHAAEGIRANVVMPGLMDTPHVAHMAATAGTAASVAELAVRRAAAPPMKRQGSAWDVAHAALFLASDEAAYITGVILPVDGGLTLQVPPA